MLGVWVSAMLSIAKVFYDGGGGRLLQICQFWPDFMPVTAFETSDAADAGQPGKMWSANETLIYDMWASGLDSGK